jgi:hypothetical protein
MSKTRAKNSGLITHQKIMLYGPGSIGTLFALLHVAVNEVEIAAISFPEVASSQAFQFLDVRTREGMGACNRIETRRLSSFNSPNQPAIL